MGLRNDEHPSRILVQQQCDLIGGEILGSLR